MAWGALWGAGVAQGMEIWRQMTQGRNCAARKDGVARYWDAVLWGLPEPVRGARPEGLVEIVVRR